MEFSLEFEQQFTQRASPTIVTFAQLLQLPGTDMLQVLHAETAQNPALELIEREVCILCGQALRRGICYDCLRREATAPPDETRHVPRVDDFDPLTTVAAPRSLPELLIEALVPVLPDEDLRIGEYLVGSLDERGFLPEAILNEVVRGLQVSPPRARAALEALQRNGPAGIGARSVRECLLLQIERMENYGPIPPLVRTLVADHLEELGRGLYTQMARRLHVTTEEITCARDFIRDRLRPYPVPEEGEAQRWSSPSDTPYVIPDVIVRADPARAGEFLVEVAESRRYAVRMNPLYWRLAESLRSGETTARMPATEREHVLSQVARAQQFMGHLRERHRTLQRVAENIAARQKEYLRHGVRFLVPLTRAQVAADLGVHESTVSRAVADKYVLLPWREMAMFSRFFNAARPIEEVLREIIGSETKPLTDDELATVLAARGYTVARRTVAKYRTRLGLLPSHLRTPGAH